RLPPAHGPACAPRGPDRRAQRRSERPRRYTPALPVLDARTTRRHRPPHWRRERVRNQVLRVRRLVALAHDLSEQAAAPREESAARSRLAPGPLLREGLRAHGPRPGAGPPRHASRDRGARPGAGGSPRIMTDLTCREMTDFPADYLD